MTVSLVKAPITHYVLIFETSLALGGREEGDWWVKTGDLEFYYPCTSEEEAEELAKELREGEFKGKDNLSSVNHRVGDTYDVEVSERVITHFPEIFPHYE